MPSSTNVTFFNWLVQQTSRADSVGVFARYAASDKAFPRQYSNLHVVLSRYHGMPVQRDGAKTAHREWRLLKARCSECNGSGRTDNHVTGEVECSSCEGTGRKKKGGRCL